jgi:hypothetical protein
MSGERSATERILNVLRPFASNWSGTLGRGDLVIPQRDIPRLISDILDAARECDEPRCEASESEIFRVISEAQNLPSMQDLARRLVAEFIILKR